MSGPLRTRPTLGVMLFGISIYCAAAVTIVAILAFVAYKSL